MVPIAPTPFPLSEGPETTEIDVESDERIERPVIEPHPPPVNILKVDFPLRFQAEFLEPDF
jgi:hypothetical protein